MRTTTAIQTTQDQLLALHQQFSISASLLSGDFLQDKYSKYYSLHAFGAQKILACNSGTALANLQKMITDKDWLFGILGYDLKNEIEELSSNNFDGLAAPELVFFVPKFVVIEKTKNQFELLSYEAEGEFMEFLNSVALPTITKQKIDLQTRISKAEYEQGFQAIKNYIRRGSFYEMNYCQEFYQEKIEFDLWQFFMHKRQTVTTPFMAFFQYNEWQLASFSPERYLAKRGHQLISQPIKGTAKRGDTPAQDEANRIALSQSLKERTENTMIVDLVRNDLGRCAKPGGVSVPEYLQLYTFPNIHQLVSTITADIPPELTFSEIICRTFPMGSMTGAPKLNVMQITEQLEQAKRGWYSGALGYIEPNGEFDFSVIIRSLLYNAATQYLSYKVGGGITSFSSAEQEYEECFTKLQSVID